MSIQTWFEKTSHLKSDADSVAAALCNPDRWPGVLPGVERVVRLSAGRWAVGSNFLVVASIPNAPAWIRSLRTCMPANILELDPHRLTFGVELMNGGFRHTLALTKSGPNTCRLHHTEVGFGWLTRFAAPLQRIANVFDAAWSTELERKFGIAT
jgi:hypothetical protein